MRSVPAVIAAALLLAAGSAEGIAFQQMAEYAGASCSAVLTVPAQGTCPAAVMKPCAATATGSGQILCTATPDFTLGATGTYAIGSIFPTESCANASNIMAALAIAPGVCTSLSSVGFPVYGKADCTGAGSIRSYLDAACTQPASGQDLTMDGTCRTFSIFGYKGSCSGASAPTSEAAPTATAAPTSAAPTSAAATTTAAAPTSTSKPASAGKLCGSLVGAAVAAVVAVAAF